LKTKNIKTDIRSDHNQKYPDRLPQEKGHCKTKDYIVRQEAAQKMRVGPSESACRSWLQTT